MVWNATEDLGFGGDEHVMDLPFKAVDMAKSYKNLPEELVVEIMSWLIPKSLVRFKSVCRRWNSLITCLIKDPEFVAKHLHNAQTNTLYHTTLLIHYNFSPHPWVTPSVTYLTRFWSNFTEEDDFNCITFDVNSRHLIGKSRMLLYRFKTFSCNGIICFVDSESIALSNPALAEFKKFVPQSTIKMDDHRVKGIGFGCDSSGDNYKLVRILSDHVGVRAEVYNFGTNHSWREINFLKQVGSSFVCHHHVYYKGVCYWLILGLSNMVLSFDVGREVFRGVPLPADLHRLDLFPSSSLGVWNDSVYLFCYPGGRGIPKSIKMWVMDVNYNCDVGCSCSFVWRNYARTEPLEGIHSPLTFWKSDELLMNTEDHRVVSYNLRTQKTRNLYEHGADGLIYSGHYVKSLVSIRGREEI